MHLTNELRNPCNPARKKKEKAILLRCPKKTLNSFLVLALRYIQPQQQHERHTSSTRVCLRMCMRVCGCLSVCVCVLVYMCVFVSLTSDSSSSGNPSRLPGQPAPTFWCMRSRWSGVAATTAQPYLITNKRVVPSVRYQAFSTKQTVIPASQTLALLSLPTTWWELHWDRRSNYTPYLTSIATEHT